MLRLLTGRVQTRRSDPGVVHLGVQHVVQDLLLDLSVVGLLRPLVPPREDVPLRSERKDSQPSGGADKQEGTYFRNRILFFIHWGRFLVANSKSRFGYLQISNENLLKLLL